MTGYYDIVTKIYNHLDNDPLINQVTKGKIDEVCIAKWNMYPLAHLIVNNVTFDESVIRFNLSLMVMDVVDFSKDETATLYVGNNNLDDVLNTTLTIQHRIYESLRRGDLWDDLAKIASTGNCEDFQDKFTDSVAGWTQTFEVEVANEMTIC
jgi:hypothetical protein